METEAVRSSKLFEMVRFYSGSWTASARVGNAGVRGNFRLRTHFQLFSSPSLTSLEQMFDLFCAHSSLLGLLTKRETLQSTPALFLIRSNLAKSVFSPAAFPAFASPRFSLLSSHHPSLNFHHCGDAKCTSLSGPFSIKWRAARETNFQPSKYTNNMLFRAKVLFAAVISLLSQFFSPPQWWMPLISPQLRLSYFFLTLFMFAVMLWWEEV